MTQDFRSCSDCGNINIKAQQLAGEAESDQSENVA